MPKPMEISNGEMMRARRHLLGKIASKVGSAVEGQSVSKAGVDSVHHARIDALAKACDAEACRHLAEFFRIAKRQGMGALDRLFERPLEELTPEALKRVLETTKQSALIKNELKDAVPLPVLMKIDLGGSLRAGHFGFEDGMRSAKLV